MANLKSRNSSIEFIRILSMIFVIAYHWQLHAYGHSIWNSPISANQIFSFAIGSWGSLGVDLFFIIFAYFQINKRSIKLNRIMSIIIKVSFYGTVVLLLANVMGIEKFSFIETIKSIGGVFLYQYWFLTVYLIIYIASPALNRIINELSLKYLSILLDVLIYATYFISFAFGNEILGRTACGFVIYLLVGFVEKYPKFNYFNKFKVLGIFSLVIVLLFEIVCSYIGTYNYPIFFKLINRVQITQSPVMLICAMLLFYQIKNWNIKTNVVLNFLGRYSVGAYLLHGGSGFLKNYVWDDLFNGAYYYQCAPYVYIFHYVLSVFLMFAVGVICEFVYVHTIDKLVLNKVSGEDISI